MKNTKSSSTEKQRPPPSRLIDARIKELETAGAEVRVYRGDVADRASLAGVLEAIRAAQPPLRGIVHAASAIDDGLASEIDIAQLQAVLRH